MQEHRRWLAEAGVTAGGPVEIDPLAGISSADIQGELEPWQGEVFTGPLFVSRHNPWSSCNLAVPHNILVTAYGARIFAHV